MLRILPNAPEIEPLRDLASLSAKALTDSIFDYPHVGPPTEECKENHRAMDNAAAAIFKALGQMSIKGSVLQGDERLDTIQSAFEWLQIVADDWDYDIGFLRYELGEAVRHIGAFLHAIKLFTVPVDGGAKTPAPPAESENPEPVANQPDTEIGGNSEVGEATKKQTKLPLDAQAVAWLVEDIHMSNAAIGRKIGCSGENVRKMKKVREARELAQLNENDIPSGSKDDGHMEARF